MGKQELDNLVNIGALKKELPSRAEYDGMLDAARRSLADAQKGLDPDNQFTLVYGAAHRLALAALRREGYRSEKRISVFQTIVHTVGTGNADIQVFLKAHNTRNLAEYEGYTEVDPRLLADLLDSTKRLEAAVGKLEPPKDDE